MERGWTAGDVVLLRLPIHQRWTRPDRRVDAVRGCVALKVGPIVCCLELLPDDELDLDAVTVEPAAPKTIHLEELDGVPALIVEADDPATSDRRRLAVLRRLVTADRDGRAVAPPVDPRALPQLGKARPSRMRVWLPSLSSTT